MFVRCAFFTSVGSSFCHAISALESAMQTGSMGISSNMEQHSRLLILLQPATGIDLGIDDE